MSVVPSRSALALALCAALTPLVASAQTHDINAMARESAARLVERASGEERAGRPLVAESLYLQALSIDRAAVSASLGAARLLDVRGRRDEALRVVRAVPRRALVGAARVEVARALHTLSDDEAALALLRDDERSELSLREHVSLCAEIGRFPEALAAARRWSNLPELAEPSRRHAALTARALERLVAEADAVRYAPGASALRRLLRGQPPQSSEASTARR